MHFSACAPCLLDEMLGDFKPDRWQVNHLSRFGRNRHILARDQIAASVTQWLALISLFACLFHGFSIQICSSRAVLAHSDAKLIVDAKSPFDERVPYPRRRFSMPCGRDALYSRSASAWRCMQRSIASKNASSAALRLRSRCHSKWMSTSTSPYSGGSRHSRCRARSSFTMCSGRQPMP